MPERYDIGMATRRAVLGDAHVDRAEAAKTAFDAPFQSLITLALLAALGNHEEVAMHVRATANTGASPQDVREAMLHVAIYAGVPRANHALKIIKETYEAMGVET